MRSLPSLHVRRAAGVALVFLGTLASPGARADIDLPTVPPAQPEAVTAKVFLGETVEIPLRGVSRSGRQLEFLIRRAPEVGALSEVVTTGRGTATVTYTHPPGAGPGVDRFRYAVRSPGTGVSTAAEVTVVISERPPVFAAPRRLGFPDVPVGSLAQETITLRNDGGGEITGQLVVPAPWTMAEGDGRYSLGPGESAELTLTFTPTEDRRYAEIAEYTPGVELGLEGRGFQPVQVVPREVRLESEGVAETRTGGFLLRNVSDEDRELRLALPPEVVGPEMIAVPAKSEVSVTLRTRPGSLGALAGKVRVADGEIRVEVPLRVVAAPARLVVEPAAVDLGVLAAGRSGRAMITLRNAGGSPAEVRAKVPPGVGLEPDPSYEPLAPGASREFAVTFARPGAAKLDDVVAFEVGGSSLALPVRAEVNEAPAVAAVPTTAGADQAADPTGRPVAPKFNDLPPLTEINFVQTRTGVEVFWKRNSPDVVRYALVLRKIDFNDRGDAVFKYIPLPRVKPRLVRNEVRASLDGLRPGESVTLLIVGYDAAGTPTAPSPPFVVFQKPREPWRIPWFWLGCLAVIALGLVIVRERRRARAAAMAGL